MGQFTLQLTLYIMYAWTSKNAAAAPASASTMSPKMKKAVCLRVFSDGRVIPKVLMNESARKYRMPIALLCSTVRVVWNAPYPWLGTLGNPESRGLVQAS